jgi:hypothetical protein
MTTTTTQGNAMAPEFRAAQNFQPSTDIVAYAVVKYDGTNAPDGVVVTAADTDLPMGVLAQALKRAGGVEGSNVSDVGDMVIKGRTRVIASGMIGANARIAPAANGKVQAAASGDMVMGTAKEAAASDGDIIMAEIDCTACQLM